MLTLLLKFISLFTFLNYVNCDLYNSSDPLVILNVNNFHQIMGTENAWLIEYYASWCGHCQKFAPIWRQLAHSMQDWDHTIKVGVIDCADAENAPICRDYEVVSYPTIRIFGAMVQEEIGTSISGRTVEEIEDFVIQFIIENELNDTASPSWIKLLPYEFSNLGSGDVKDVIGFAPPEATDAVLVIDNLLSNVGRTVVMDLAHFPSVYPRLVPVDAFAAFAYTQLPAIIIVHRDRSVDKYDNIGGTREETTAFVMEKLNLMRTLTDNVVLDDKTSSSSEPQTPQIVATPGKVYMVDLENALSYSLTHEVLLYKLIAGELFQTLKDYIHVLAKYLPLRYKVKAYVKRLDKYLQSQNGVISEEVLSAKISDLNTEDAFLPSNQSWIGCSGSEDKYRGYPCGLWTTFHALTVESALIEKNNPDFDGNEVLRAIHGYVKNFFSCSHCSNHFQEMYGIDAEVFGADANHGLLWLWKGHNKVNRRLAGDVTEDPKHPKKQFPSVNLCPDCYDGGSFNEPRSLKYIVNMYKQSSVSLEGIIQFGVGNGGHVQGRTSPAQTSGPVQSAAASKEDVVTLPAMMAGFIFKFLFNL